MTTQRSSLMNTLVFRSLVSSLAGTWGSMKLAVATRGALMMAILAALLPVAARSAQAQTETVLYNFTGGSDGGGPLSALVSHGGNLYGTTVFGGVGDSGSGAGTIFELSPNGAGGWNETVLYNFCSEGGASCTDGAYPDGPVLFDSVGNLYGATPEGGSASCPFTVGCGVVFELSPLDTGWTETVLHTFCLNFTGECVDGVIPSGILRDAQGNLYGEVTAGVFELTPSSSGWSYKFISFNIENSTSGLTMDADGNIYGTGNGIVFELSPNGKGGWTTTVLYTFVNTSGVVAWGPPLLD